MPQSTLDRLTQEGPLVEARDDDGHVGTGSAHQRTDMGEHPMTSARDPRPSRVRFTIVTPVLNGMPWLPETVASVELQRNEVDVEHIVLDGGSTDGSREWLQENSAKASVLIFEPDHGQTDALIRGFKAATGDVLGWLNADDVLESGALGRVVQAFQAHPDAVAVTGTAIQIGPEGKVIGLIPTPPSGTFAGLLAHPTNLAQPSTFFRRRAYEQVGGLDPSLDLAMDVDLWLRLARLGRVVLVRDALSRFRIHPNAKSVAGARKAASEDLRVRRRQGLPLFSPAGLTLLKVIYWFPVRARVGRTLRRLKS